MIEKILELIFPRKCGFCDTLIKNNYVCEKCKKNLESIFTNGKIVKVKGKYFEILISSYFYTGIIRKRLMDFKFKNKKFLYKSLSEKLLENVQELATEIDGIIAVPISVNRYFERGYNQSKLIAKYISENLNKPLYNYTLIKVKNNLKQSEIDMKTRLCNVSNVYKVFNKKVIYGKKILLIDDIYTTGATVNECSRVLKQNGAKQIIVATIAKTELK